MVKQSALTLITPVQRGEELKLEGILSKIRTDLANDSFNLFENIGTIHYARFVVLQNQLSNNQKNLVFSSDYDGLESEHLLKLSNAAADLIDSLYSCCEGYPPEANRTATSRKEYLSRWSIKAASFYIGAPGREVQQIRQESELRNYIWNQLNEGNWKESKPVEVHRQLRETVLKQEKFSWVKQKIQLPRVRWMNFVWLVLAGLVLFPLTILAILFIITWLLILHFKHEKKDKPLGLTPSQIDEAHVKELEEYEDVHNQNQFTQIVPMRPGIMRLWTLKALMAYARFRVNTEFRLGKLMGIPTIHFARWVLIDNNKQVLFFSNFDGSWQQYLGDFIDKSGWGLTAIFSNTKDFPETRFLFWGGAYDEEHFLAWARYTQVPTAVWYCAYPHLSIKNINNNSAIRVELMEDLDEGQSQQFLNRF